MPLPTPRTPDGAAGLAAIIADPERAVVALDFDGTLSPIVDRPMDAKPHPRALDTLRRLADVVGAVAIVTGRPAATLVELAGLPLAGDPGAGSLGRLVVLGHYGLERWDARSNEVVRPELPPGVADARTALADIVAGAAEGTVLEDKEASLAVHTRRAADPDGVLAALRPALEDVAERTGLVVEPGRMVIELRPPGTDKGVALTTLVTERAARSVLYAGDDLGDLAAYDAVEALRSKGIPGTTVCAGSVEVTRLAERADIVVDGPAGVVALLDSLVARVGTGG